MKRSAIIGAVAALVGMFPAAGFLALVWKFPIPLGGYVSGVEGALLTPIAVLVYGALGGFAVVPAMGAVSGALAFHLAHGNPLKARTVSALFGLSCALAAGVFLNVLDKIIGPW